MTDHNNEFKFKVVWYFCSQQKVDQRIQQLVKDNYAKLGIKMESNIMYHPSDIKDIVKSQLWSQASINKIAIYDFKGQRNKINDAFKEENYDYKSWLQLKNISEIERIFQETTQRVQLCFYQKDENMEVLIEHAFSQMKIQEDNDFLPDKIQLKQQNWNEIFPFIMKFYSCLSDRDIFDRSMIEIGGAKQIQYGHYLEEYMKNRAYRQYISEYQKKLYLKDNCEKVGHQIKNIYQQIRKGYLQQNQYLKRGLIECWQLMSIEKRQINIKVKQNLYLNKTFGIYYNSLKQLIQKQKLSPDMHLTVIKLILRNPQIIQISQEEKFSKFNHGFYIISNKIIINSMNIFKLKNIRQAIYTPKKRQKIVLGQQQLNFKMTQLHFQQVSFQDLISINMSHDQNRLSQRIKNLFKFAKNKLQKFNYQISLENAYLENHQFLLAGQVLKKKKEKQLVISDQLYDKLGLQQIKVDINFNRDETGKSIYQMGLLCKDLCDQESYLFCLKKYVQQLQNSDDVFEKYVEKAKILIEISLIEGLKQQGQSFSLIDNLNKISHIFQYLGSYLSHQHYQNKKRQSQQKQNFLKKFCHSICKKDQFEQSQQIQEYDYNLQQQFFNQKELNKSSKLLKFKQQFCRLFYMLKKAIMELYRYGDKSLQLINIKKFEQNVFQIKRRSKLNQGKSTSSIKIYQRQFQQYNSQIQQRRQTISEIILFPIRQASSIARKSIIDRDELIDWESTNVSLESMIKQMEIKQRQFQESHKHTQEKFQQEALHIIYQERLEITKDQIQFLKLNHYSNNSISLLKLYKKQSQIAYKLKNIQQLQKLSRIQFEEQKMSNVLFKANTYQKIALLYFQKDDFENTIENVQRSLKFYRKGNVKNMNILLNLILLRIKAKVRMLSISKQNNLAQININKQISMIKYQIQIQWNNWNHLNENKLQFFVIELDLIKIELLEQCQQNKYQQIMKFYENIALRRRQFYDERQISSIMIYIDVIRIMRINQKKEISTYIDRIIQAFQHPLESQEKLIKNYNWVKNLVLFYRQQGKELKYLDILPARQYIEHCLFDFKELNKGKLSFQLKKHYSKVYQTYTDFMTKKLKYFFQKENIMEKHETTVKMEEYSFIQDVKKLQQNKHFNKFAWIFFVQKQQILNQYQKIKKRFSSKNQNPFAFNINELNNKINNISKNLRIKLVLSANNFYQLIKQQYSQYSIIEKVDILKVITDKNTNLQDLYLRKKHLKCNIEIIKQFKQIIEDLYGQQQDIEDNDNSSKRYMNAIFYEHRFKEKIYQYHIIVLSSLCQVIHEETKQTKQIFDKFVRAFLVQINKLQQKNILDIQQFVQCGIELRNQRNQIRINNRQQQMAKMLQKCKQIIMLYKKQTIVYQFINNSIRSIYEDIEFEWICLQKHIFPLYQSIKSLFEHNVRSNKFNLGQKLTLFRIAQMQMSQFNLFKKQIINKEPFIEFLSFLSTTTSFQWIIRKLMKISKSKLSKNIFKQYAIFVIQVQITEQFLTSPLNNGFYQLEDDQQQQQLLFNIFNIFKVCKVSRHSVKSIMKKFKQYISPDRLAKYSQNQLIKIQSSLIRIIHLRAQDLSNYVQKKLTNQHSHYNFFQQVQSKFLKKRKKYEATKNNITISTFGIIQSYESLGKISKAVQQILQIINSDRFFLLKENCENLIIRAAKNCIKMGDLNQAELILQQFPKLQIKKRELRQHYEKIKIQNEIYDIKFNAIKLLIDQKSDIEKCDRDIEKLHQQIKQIMCANSYQRLNKKAKQIYIGLYKSINLYGIGDIDKSINELSKALDQLTHFAQQLAKQDIKQDKNIRIQHYCEKILSQMKQKLIQYHQHLNKKYQGDILKLQNKLMKVSNQFQSLQGYNQFQSNAFCCQYASSCISTEHNDDILEQKSVCEELQTLTKVSMIIEEEQSRILLQPQKTRQIIKQTSFQLLGKLQVKKLGIINISNQGMQQIMTKYSKMITQIIKSQIKYLQQDGYKRQSSPLIRKYNQINKHRLQQRNFDQDQLKKQLQTNLTFCKNKDIEKCRSSLLMLELEYLLVQRQLIETEYRDINNPDLYSKAQKYLKQARSSILSAYKLSKYVDKLSFFMSKKQKKKYFSDQNLQIVALDLKIKHGKFRTGQKKNKQLLLQSLQNLGNLVNSKKYKYDVLNEEIFVYQMHSLYALNFYNSIKFQDKIAQFLVALKARENIKGQNNTENGESCLQLFQLMNTNLRKQFAKTYFDTLYKYIEMGTWNCENNSLFWRFAICKFNSIKKKGSNQKYAFKKLNYIYQILTTLLQYGMNKQSAINNIEKAFLRFQSKFIQRNKVQQRKINELITKIKQVVQKLRHKELQKSSQEIPLKKNEDQQNKVFEQQKVAKVNQKKIIKLQQQKRQNTRQQIKQQTNQRARQLQEMIIIKINQKYLQQPFEEYKQTNTIEIKPSNNLQNQGQVEQDKYPTSPFIAKKSLRNDFYVNLEQSSDQLQKCLQIDDY